jgi:type IV pilus assembly protein PilA
MKRLNALLERRKEDAGFTLIELMVVVLIIGILIAIAIPTFLGARTRAQDRAAQSNLRNTVTNAKAIFTDQEDYNLATTTELQKAEPELVFKNSTTDSTKPTEVSVNGGLGTGAKSTVFAAAGLSNSGTCWFVRQSDNNNDTASKGLTWGKRANATAAGNCQASLVTGNGTNASNTTGDQPGAASTV